MDLISRQAAIVQLSHNKTGDDDCDVVIQNDIETIKSLPSAPRLHITEYIPVAWIENEIEWLRGLENCFSDLTAMNIESMLKRWREQQESEEDKDGRGR